MLKIANGLVYDPRNSVSGEKRDIYINDGGRVVDSLPDNHCQVVDASGCVVFPGGVELHSHIVGTKVNSARSMCPEDHYDHFKTHSQSLRAGVGYTVPSTYYTGYEYAQLGYTTLFEAAVPPLEARHAHEELKDVPLVDSGVYTLMGNNYFAMKIISDPDPRSRRERLNALAAWLLKATKGYTIKVVNPGGVESWKWNKGAADLDTPVAPFGVTPRQIMLELAQSAADLKLPHGMHLHANHLGEAGNFQTTLETLSCLEGLPVHLTHLQFHSYGSSKRGAITSAAPQLAQFFNDHPQMTFDVGQIVFGPATTMTADSPMEHHLHTLTGHKWINGDVEMETGSGVVPMVYKPQAMVNAVQWCIGLELMLLVKNPWQIALTTDHPNAGPFTAYPYIIKLLMNKDFRQEILSTLPPAVKKFTCLAELDREYTLEEIAIITRGAAGRILGLPNRGHLAAGAEGDVAIYRLGSDWEQCFRYPAYVYKSGQLAVKDGQAQQTFYGRRLLVQPEGPDELPADLVDDFKHFYSVELANFPVQDEYLLRPEVIPCR